MAPQPTPPKPSKTPTTLRLLHRSHSPTTASSIHTAKISRRPLQLHPSTTPKPAPGKDAREARRTARNKRLESQHRRRKKPQPLSAAEKRRLCLYDIPKAERKYEIYEGLWRLWCAYMREVLLGWPAEGEVVKGRDGAVDADLAGSKRVVERRGRAYVETQQAGAKVAGADFHGALLEVVRNGCVGRVGVKGIVVRDTMFTFEVITRGNEVKTLPKEGTVFRFVVPLGDEGVLGDDGEEEVEKEGGKVGEKDGRKGLVFELHGEQFKFRAPDRANKKFRWHLPKDYT